MTQAMWTFFFSCWLSESISIHGGSSILDGRRFLDELEMKWPIEKNTSWENIVGADSRDWFLVWIHWFLFYSLAVIE